MLALTRLVSIAALSMAAVVAASAARAEKKYDTGASDTEIKIGNIMPYSGPASSYAVIGKTEAAYFDMINAQGGINGRKIKFISYDDAYSPPKAIEQARKLVEGDEVLFLFQPLGTPSRYLDVNIPCAKGENAMQPAPTSSRASSRPPSIQRFSIE